MYNNTIVNTKKKLTIEDIHGFEKEYNFTMPYEVKEHYLSYNGGYPEKAIYVMGGREYVVNYFFSICCGEGLALEKTMKLLDDERIFPKWLIPFANDEGGNFFCYSIKAGEEGKIYYYNHEFEYGENPEKYVCELTDSLVTFINALQE